MSKIITADRSQSWRGHAQITRYILWGLIANDPQFCKFTKVYDTVSVGLFVAVKRPVLLMGPATLSWWYWQAGQEQPTYIIDVTDDVDRVRALVRSWTPSTERGVLLYELRKKYMRPFEKQRAKQRKKEAPNVNVSR